jgi:hypothetical protein
MRLASAFGLVLAILALPSSASAALQISSPSLVPVINQSGYVTYEVSATATGQYEHTRSEGAIVADAVSAGGTGEGIGFIRDYSSKTKTLHLPTNPRRPTLMLLSGETYIIRIHWLAGGGGCSTCDEDGDSPPYTFKVPGADPKSRLDLERKLDFSTCAQKFRDAAMGDALPILFAFTSETRHFYMEKMSRDIAMSRSCRELAADPIDRHFKAKAKLRRPPASTFKAGSAGAAGKPLAAALASEGKLAVQLEALTVSINRAQGATKAHKRRFERMQMLEAAGHAVDASRAAKALAAALPRAGAALQAGYPQIAGHAVTDEELASGIAQLAGGLPAGQVPVLKRFGVTHAQLRDATAMLNNSDSVGGATLGTLLSDAATIDNLKRQAKGLRGLAATWKRHPTAEVSG